MGLQVIGPVEDYLKLLRTIFDFDALKALLRIFAGIPKLAI